MTLTEALRRCALGWRVTDTSAHGAGPSPSAQAGRQRPPRSGRVRAGRTASRQDRRDDAQATEARIKGLIIGGSPVTVNLLRLDQRMLTGSSFDPAPKVMWVTELGPQLQRRCRRRLRQGRPIFTGRKRSFVPVMARSIAVEASASYPQSRGLYGFDISGPATVGSAQRQSQHHAALRAWRRHGQAWGAPREPPAGLAVAPMLTVRI